MLGAPAKSEISIWNVIVSIIDKVWLSYCLAALAFSTLILAITPLDY
jgi:hypothetical protein